MNKKEPEGQFLIRKYEKITDIGQLPYRSATGKEAILGFFNQVSPFSENILYFYKIWLIIITKIITGELVEAG